VNLDLEDLHAELVGSDPALSGAVAAAETVSRTGTTATRTASRGDADDV